MTDKLPAIQQALEHSYSHSSRPGKWSTVPDVRDFEENTTLTSLRRLVKQGAASEKVKGGIALKLFKPTRSGGGAAGLADEDGKKERRSDKKTRGLGRPTGRKTKGKGSRKGKGDRKVKASGKRNGGKPGKTSKNPLSWKNPKPGDAVKNTLNTGIATLLVGGMGSSMGGVPTGSGSTPTLPTIRM